MGYGKATVVNPGTSTTTGNKSTTQTAAAGESVKVGNKEQLTANQAFGERERNAVGSGTSTKTPNQPNNNNESNDNWNPRTGGVTNPDLLNSTNPVIISKLQRIAGLANFNSYVAPNTYVDSTGQHHVLTKGAKADPTWKPVQQTSQNLSSYEARPEIRYGLGHDISTDKNAVAYIDPFNPTKTIIENGREIETPNLITTTKNRVPGYATVIYDNTGALSSESVKRLGLDQPADKRDSYAIREMERVESEIERLDSIRNGNTIIAGNAESLRRNQDFAASQYVTYSQNQPNEITTGSMNSPNTFINFFRMGSNPSLITANRIAGEVNERIKDDKRNEKIGQIYINSVNNYDGKKYADEQKKNVISFYESRGFSKEEAEKRYEKQLKAEASNSPFVGTYVYGFLKNYNIDLDDLPYENPYVVPYREQINLTLTEEQAKKSEKWYKIGDGIERLGEKSGINQYGFAGDVAKAAVIDNIAGFANFLGVLEDTESMIYNNYKEKGIRGAVDVTGHQLGAVLGGTTANIVNDPVGGMIGLYGPKTSKIKGSGNLKNIAKVYDDTSSFRSTEPYYRDDQGEQQENNQARQDLLKKYNEYRAEYKSFFENGTEFI